MCLKINSIFYMLLITMLYITGCDDSNDSSDTIASTDSSSLDRQLQSIINEKGLTGDPSIGRQIPDINTSLAQLGKKLFFSKSLGGDTDTACVSCHHPVLGGGDALPLSIGIGAVLPDQLGPGRRHSSLALNFDGGPTVPRNAPTTFNIALWDQVLFHDGRVESLGKTPNVHGNDGLGIRTPDSSYGTADPVAGLDLAAAQSRFPVTSPDEMQGFIFEAGNSNQAIRDALARRLMEQTIPNTWLEEFRLAFSETITRSEDYFNFTITYSLIAEAISAYERSQLFINTPWKQYVAGDQNALTETAKKGALLFFQSIEEGGADCASCHSGDFFTDEQFYVLAIPQIGRGKGDGFYGDDDFGRFRETQNPADKYAFRTPSLLNVEVTGPYGHDGAYQNLADIIHHHLSVEEAINHYDFTLSQLEPSIQHEHAEENTRGALIQLQANRAAGLTSIQDVPLNDEQIAYLVEFLQALTDPCVTDRACLAPWIANTDDVGPDSLQLNAVNEQGILW